MSIYIAMLRGINIGPHKRIKMEKLRACCEALKFERVETYIQSGNVVFKAAKLSPAAVSKKLEGRIVTDFGFQVDVITRTCQELQKIVGANPLLKEPSLDESKFHVTFLSDVPDALAIKKLQALTLPPDQVRVSRREIYFYFPNGVSGSSLWKHNLDRVLSVTGTMRNWRTVCRLDQMASELA